MVQLQQLDDDDRDVRAQHRAGPLDSHRVGRGCRDPRRTGSTRPGKFKKVMPIDYSRVLGVMKQAEADGLDEQQTLGSNHGGRLVGEMTGFLKWQREMPSRREVPVRLRDWKEVYNDFPLDKVQIAGRPLHGLRHPVLQQRLPARQPDPRLERPRLSRALARCDRPPARDQQLPGVHRPAVPGAVRGGVRARHQRRPGDHQAGRGGDHRSGVGRRLGRAAVAECQDRQARRGDRLGPCRVGVPRSS